jgi:hypothetical protein
MMTSRPVEAGRAIAHGVVGGIIGAVVMMLVEVAGALLEQESPFLPMQMNAALVLGPKIAGLERVGMAQLAPATTPRVLVGLGVHLTLSIAYGIILALIVLAVPRLRSSLRVLTIAGVAFGIALWLVKLALIALAASPWYLTSGDIEQLIAHGLFGGALGYYLGIRLAAAEVTRGASRPRSQP